MHNDEAVHRKDGNPETKEAVVTTDPSVAS
jgi:hypothetical protein